MSSSSLRRVSSLGIFLYPTPLQRQSASQVFSLSRNSCSSHAFNHPSTNRRISNGAANLCALLIPLNYDSSTSDSATSSLDRLFGFPIVPPLSATGFYQVSEIIESAAEYIMKAKTQMSTYRLILGVDARPQSFKISYSSGIARTPYRIVTSTPFFQHLQQPDKTVVEALHLHYPLHHLAFLPLSPLYISASPSAYRILLPHPVWPAIHLHHLSSYSRVQKQGSNVPHHPRISIRL